MPLPGGATGCTLTFGTYSDPAFVGMKGILRLSAPLVATTGDVVQRSWTVTIGVDGTTSVAGLPYNDDATFAPLGTTYTLQWQALSTKDTPGNKTFQLLQAQGATIDFDSIANADGTTTPSVAPQVPLVTSVVGQTGAVTGTQVAADPAFRAAYVPKWKASTAYASGEPVLSPTGQTVTANTAFTSGATYNSANWTIVSGGAGTVADATVSAKGIVQLAGDLAGTAAAPTVAKINGATPAAVATTGAYADLSGKPTASSLGALSAASNLSDLASAATARANLGVPVASASGGVKMRDDIQAYNISGDTLRQWLFAYAKAKNGEGRAVISLYGDSVTSGYRSSTPQYANSWPARLRVLIESRIGVVAGTGFVKPSALIEDVGDNRWSTTGTGWGGSRGSGIFRVDNYNNQGGVLTIGPITTDRIRVYYLAYSGGGTATVTLDGATVASLPGFQASGFGVKSQDYTATAGQHTLVVTAPTGTDFILLGWEAAQNGTATGIRIDNVGYNGVQASQLATTTTGSLVDTGSVMAWDTLKPNLAVICFGLNELNTSVSVATYQANVTRLVQRAQALPASVILLTPPPPGSVNDPLGNYASYVSALYSIADSQNVALLDLSKRWKDDATASAAGLKYDGQHPNSRGYWEMGNYVATALLNVAVI